MGSIIDINRNVTNIDYLNILDFLQNINVPQYRYFWIDANINSKENKSYMNFLKKYVPIQGFKSLCELEKKINETPREIKIEVVSSASLEKYEYRRLTDNQRISRILLFCQNQNAAKQLMALFQKIDSAYYRIHSLKNALFEHQKNRGMNILCLTKDHIETLGRIHMTYKYLEIVQEGERAKKALMDFIRMFEFIFKEEKLFFEDYEENKWWKLSEEERQRIILDEIFKHGNFCATLQQVGFSTMNPKKLAYLRYPMSQISSGISRFYPQTKLQKAYMVVSFTQDQVKIMEQNVNNFLSFTSFMKGYSEYKEAIAIHEQAPGSHLIQIVIPQNKSHHPPLLNTGFCACARNISRESDVIFSFPNYFRILQVHRKKIKLLYGGYSEDAQTQIADKFQFNLMLHYHHLEQMIEKMPKGQCATLEIAGFVQESINIQRKQFLQNSSQMSEAQKEGRIMMIAQSLMKKKEKQHQGKQQFRNIPQTSQNYLLALTRLYQFEKNPQKRKDLIEKIKNCVNKMRRENHITYREQYYWALLYIMLDQKPLVNLKDTEYNLTQLLQLIEQNSKTKIQYFSKAVTREAIYQKAMCLEQLGYDEEALNDLKELAPIQAICDCSCIFGKNLNRTNQFIGKLERKLNIQERKKLQNSKDSQKDPIQVDESQSQVDLRRNYVSERGVFEYLESGMNAVRTSWMRLSQRL